LEAGHEIGNHRYMHRPMLSLRESVMREELSQANALIHQELGVEPDLFRPPYLAQGVGLKLALSELHMDSILASNHGLDWQERHPQRIADKVLDGIAPGAIILLHDGDGDGDGDVDDPMAQSSRAPTAAATGIIIETLKARGVLFSTVGGLMRGRITLA
ncbi:MAG: polysaccharide deacetylase family protein, partial [Halioglobus sp.]|nr:polysaccharide deacetylase family protein [Halioglobus sp.]